MKYLYISTLLLVSLLLLGCGNETIEENSATESSAEETTPAPCIYVLGEQSAGVYWTAYKHTGKIAVNGKMDSVVVSEAVSGSSPMEVFSNVQIKIYTGSVNSKDELRDKKLREIYFGSMANTEVIEGNLISWEGSDAEGTCLLSLHMNDTALEVSGTYLVKETTVQVRFTIEPNSWGAEEAITKLGEACAEKHTGEDGKTVFWPDVDLLIEATVAKDCPDAL